MKDSFIFYRSFYESLQQLNDDDKLKIYDAVCELSLNNKDTELTGIPKAIFTLIKPQILANNQKYENGKKGGRPNQNETKTKPKQNQNETKTKPKRNQNETKTKPNVNENENENENVNGNGNVNGNDPIDSCVDGLEKVEDFYNNNIGLVTPYAHDIFTDYLHEMSPDLIILAIKKSVEANKRTLQYIKAILNNWSKSGIKNVIEAEEESKKYQKNKSKKATNFEQREYEDLAYLYANEGVKKDEQRS